MSEERGVSPIRKMSAWRRSRRWALGPGRAGAAAALAAGLAGLGAPAPLAAQDASAEGPREIVRTVQRGPAFDWRFLRGPGVQGALELVDPAATEQPETPFLRDAEGAAARGRFLLNVEGRGIFIGLYTVREDGRSIVGAFWPDGAEPTDPIAGTLDIGAAPDLDLAETEGRVRFLDGAEFLGLSAD